MRQKFKSEAETFSTHIADVTVSNNNEEEDGWIANIYKKRKVSDIDAEITRYFQEDNCEKDVNPFHYWTMKKEIFPSLSRMARACLAVPSTSTPSERAFSRGRLILHYTRSCLSAEKIRALICLSSWYKVGFC